MVDRPTPIRDTKADQIISEVSDLLDRLEVFGTQKPVALAFAALAVGVAAGMLLRKAVRI